MNLDYLYYGIIGLAYVIVIIIDIIIRKNDLDVYKKYIPKRIHNKVIIPFILLSISFLLLIIFKDLITNKIIIFLLAILWLLFGLVLRHLSDLFYVIDIKKEEDRIEKIKNN